MSTKDTTHWRVAATPKDIAEYTRLLELQEHESMIRDGMDGVSDPKERWYAARDLIRAIRENAKWVDEVFVISREHLQQVSLTMVPEDINSLADIMMLGTATPLHGEILGRAFGISSVLTALEVSACLGGSPDVMLGRALDATRVMRKAASMQWLERALEIQLAAGRGGTSGRITGFTQNKEQHIAWWEGVTAGA